MSAKVHVHMHVSDLEKSRDFYQRFFGGPPVKERAGYLKFLPELGPVNLALSAGRPERDGEPPMDHLGIQVESRERVAAELARVTAAGLPVRVEMGVDCCHANQDKFWVRDPDGVEWEVYHLNYDLPGDATPSVPDATSAVPSGLAFAEPAGCRPATCCGATSEAQS